MSPLPAEWTEQQIDSFLREYNTRSIANLTIHEAMPGHYLQIAHSNRYPSVIRSMLRSGPFIEGWAVYTERVMHEQGFRAEDPLMRLVQLKWYLRSITNALMDSAIHVDGMTREQAMQLMLETGFGEEREAAGKWVRAQLSSSQLSTYFVGYEGMQICWLKGVPASSSTSGLSTAQSCPTARRPCASCGHYCSMNRSVDPLIR